jgi:hypothetical protein
MNIFFPSYRSSSLSSLATLQAGDACWLAFFDADLVLGLMLDLSFFADGPDF